MAFAENTPNKWREWLSTFPVLLLLLFVVVAGTSENVHTQLLNTGELIWDEYFLLRGDMPQPTCNQNPDIEKELGRIELEFEAENDGLGLFDDEVFDRDATRKSIEGARALCVEKHRIALDNQTRVTTAVRVFRAIETSVAGTVMFSIETKRLTLLLILFICAFTATITRHHIVFRPVETVLDHRVASFAQLFGNGLLTVSSWVYKTSVFESGTIISHPEIYILLIVCFAVLTCINLYQLLSTPTDIKSGGSIGHALLTVPLYIYLTFSAANYFIFTEGHLAGVAIWFSQVFEQSGIFLKVGMFIWIGMLLKQSNLGKLVFDVFKPWRLSPEILAFVAIVVMAVPTAYTGASGIIIIAVGVIVYQELRRVGARRQLALAATAMSGSSGVVLRPCLLIVLIAALNKEVVTDQLYGWGSWIFMLSTLIFFIFAFITRKEDLDVRPAKEAVGPYLDAFKPLIPYILILIGICVAYAVILDAYLDEFSAPVILPVIILAFLAYEKKFGKQTEEDKADSKPLSFVGAVRAATTESTVHIGALLFVIALSFTIGGVIERSGFFDILPETFGSVWLAVGFLLMVLVGIGMIMDPFGAVLLVSGTVAQVAYKNGINPVHFWMLTLVAFELGYLTPPVALNHLLTRQVVGEEEAAKATAEAAGEVFWYRHEKILLPLVVMGTTLLLVAFVPLIVGYS